ncbi:MAG: dockerin type I repeat-containing protein [Clostridiales bacterium]|nr:dockerin type I repeat-containing protein [Clostridiales bacterium]
MKLCKRIVAALVIAAMLALCVPAFAAGPEYPEVPEGYDGYITFSVSAITMGWTYIIDPMLVPVHEGETFAAVTARVFDELGWAYTYSGTVEEGFYLTGVGCYETEPMVPEYLMNEILAYPAWAEEEFEYSFGEWTGTFTDDEILSASEYCTLSGWMFLEDDESASVGADALVVTPGKAYTWIFTIYGWGMDYGVSDGWGMFPAFDNPMEGVSRTEAHIALAQICADEELMETALDVAGDELIDFLTALYDPESSQELIDSTLAALLAALYPAETIPGDVNGDGKVSSADVLLIMRYSMGLEELEASALENADLNGDGVVDFADALLVARSIN